MDKRELIKEISVETGIPQNVLKKCIDAFLPALVNILVRGDKVTFRGLGTYSTVVLPSRKCYDPRTGKTFMSKEKKVIKLYTHDSLIKQLNS